MQFNYQTEQQHSVDVLEDVALQHKLILHNDETNTFEWVIETLIHVCKHTEQQAEQCSYFIHSKGKYAVQHGSFNTLKKMKDAITERGISATIES